MYMQVQSDLSIFYSYLEDFFFPLSNPVIPQRQDHSPDQCYGCIWDLELEHLGLTFWGEVTQAGLGKCCLPVGYKRYAPEIQLFF